MRETCNAGCERTLTVIIDERHLSSLIIIFIMHVMDQVQYIHINVSQPVHPPVEFLDYFVVICIFGSDTLHLRSALNSVFFIKTAVECIQQSLCKVCTRSEQLNLLSRFRCRYTAADGIVITPLRFHNFIVLILDRAGINRNLCCVFLKVVRKARAVQYSQVRLRARSHILQSMKETVIVLGYHMSSIQTGSTNFQGNPGRVTGEELIILRNAGKFYHAELHSHMVNELLCLCLS